VLRHRRPRHPQRGLPPHLARRHLATNLTVTKARGAPRFKIYTIFEGTSEIQRLVIACAISGLHIR